MERRVCAARLAFAGCLPPPARGGAAGGARPPPPPRRGVAGPPASAPRGAAAARLVRRGGAGRRGGGGGGCVAMGPSAYSTPSGFGGNAMDECRPAWSPVNGGGPFGAAEDDALTSLSPNVVTFMNNTHRQDLALYALTYGDKLVRWSGGGAPAVVLTAALLGCSARWAKRGSLVAVLPVVAPPWCSKRVLTGRVRAVSPLFVTCCFCVFFLGPFRAPPGAQTDLALLDNVSLVSIDASGAVLELLICQPSDDSCVAILERLPWPDARTCVCIDDVVTSFGIMSVGVGLSGDI